MWTNPHYIHILRKTPCDGCGRIETNRDAPSGIYRFLKDRFQQNGTYWNGFSFPLNKGNNPMVGMTVSVAVAVEESLKK